MVDYVFVSTKHIKMFENLYIDYVSDLISQNGIEVEKFPSDHSILSGSVRLLVPHSTTPNRSKSVNSLQTSATAATQ